MNFHLGAHHPLWLERAPFPLFISHRRLATRRRLPRAMTGWALDSGGSTELRLHRGWQMTPAGYVAAVRRYSDEIGRLESAARQDWMCEPFMLAKTGLKIAEHQVRTVANYLELHSLSPDLPFVPVLQGWSRDDYLRCVELYQQAGIDLAAKPLVDVGSVCRRQATGEIEATMHVLASLVIPLHGFGVKAGGLVRYSDCLASADSFAWSFEARRSPPLAGCTPRQLCELPAVRGGVARADAGAAGRDADAPADGGLTATPSRPDRAASAPASNAAGIKKPISDRPGAGGMAIRDRATQTAAITSRALGR